MMQDLFTIDYLTFSLKPDKLAENKKDIDLAFVVDLLNLHSEWLNFEHVGGRNGYPVCYQYNDVLIHVPAEEHYERMGFCVMMKGNGLRWYASLFPRFDMAGFLRGLVKLTETGLSLNISRIDVAMDDKPSFGKGVLDLDEIVRKAEADEYVSTARSRETVREIVKVKGGKVAGRTVYFGSRVSSSYVRIYGKAVEQGVSGHWIRVEFEFKQETAMRIVNAIALTGGGFPAYFAKVANHYLRFIELDDCNRSRCSVSGFWAKFLGTMERCKLSVLPYKKQTLSKLFNHMLHSYSPSLYVLLEAFPLDFLLDIFRRNGKPRLKRKHFEMLSNPDIFDAPFSSSEKWQREVPVSVFEQLALC